MRSDFGKTLLLCALLGAALPAAAQGGPGLKAGLRALGDVTLKTAAEDAVLKNAVRHAALTAETSALSRAAAAQVGAPAVSGVEFSRLNRQIGQSLLAEREALEMVPSFGAVPGILTEYPTADLAFFYKRVHYMLGEDLASADVLNNPAYGEDLKTAYRTLVGEMQELDYKMAAAVQQFLWGQRDLYALEDINRATERLTPQIAQMQQRLGTTSALEAFARNVRYYTAAVMRMPYVDARVKQTLPFNAEAFNLSPFAYIPEVDEQAIIESALPEQLRLAVVHDDAAVYAFFRTAQQKGYLPASWQVDVFEHASDFLPRHAQQPYRLIISDRGLDDTFDKLLLTLRNRNDSTPVIAHTAGMTYGPRVLYDKGYCAFFPIAEITPEALQFMLKKYIYYAEKGVLPALGK